MCYMQQAHRPGARNRPRAEEPVGVRELRQNLSVYLARLSTGVTYRVTDRGKAVALLIPLPEQTSVLERLVASGRASAPTGDLLDLPRLQGRRSAKVSNAVIDDRDDRL
jgi:antitoxin (DNA-binding transcriptional repressor) of toxin-antitoxin stability system